MFYTKLFVVTRVYNEDYITCGKGGRDFSTGQFSYLYLVENLEKCFPSPPQVWELHYYY